MSSKQNGKKLPSQYSLEYIDELPIDSGEEVAVTITPADGPSTSQAAPPQFNPALYTFPQHAPYSFDPPQFSTSASVPTRSSSTPHVPTHVSPSTSRALNVPRLRTITLNPLGRPVSDIYKNIESPHYDTYSEESKDVDDSNERDKKEMVTRMKRYRFVKKEKTENVIVQEDQQPSTGTCLENCLCFSKCKK